MARERISSASSGRGRSDPNRRGGARAASDKPPRQGVSHDRAAHARQLRIIGGTWRGRRFRFPPLPEIRPTPDRVRETLFNWLGSQVSGARCLDLFAGSGALGLEALSRGAAEVVFVERDRTAARELAARLAEWGAKGARVEQRDALQFLHGAARPFDIVFLDPPFAVAGDPAAEGPSAQGSARKGPRAGVRPARNGLPRNGPAPNGPAPNGAPPDGAASNGPAPNGPPPLLQNATELLESRGWLTSGALVYIECAARVELAALPGRWTLLKEKRAGEVGYHLAARSVPETQEGAAVE